MRHGPKQIVRRLLEKLGADLERRGWKVSRPPRDSLWMTRDDTDGIEQVLWVTQPLSQKYMPSAELTGFDCSVRLFYPELETVILKATGQDPATTLKTFVVLSLPQLIGPEKFFAGTVYLIEKDLDEGQRTIFQMLEDYDTFVEPLRRRLVEPGIFFDDAFTPSIRQHRTNWAWDWLRAAWYALHADAPATTRLFDRLEAQCQSAIAREAGSNLPGRGSVFTDIETLTRSSELDAAKELSAFLKALRSFANLTPS